MKKLLKLLTSFALCSTLTTSVVSCGSSWINYDPIERPEPVYYLKQTGFEKFSGDKIDVTKFTYTYDLIDEINFYLEEGGYDTTSMQWSIIRNKMQLEKGLEDNLLRNGTYIFTITNSNMSGESIVVEQKITNSKYLPDVITRTTLGDIEDNRIKTILMKMIFNNLGLIARMDDVANEMLDNDNINPEDDYVLLDFGEFDSNNRDKFYGQVTLTYNQVGYDQVGLDGVIDINELAAQGGNRVNNDLGQLWSVSPYLLLTQYITNNFASRLQYLSILINDLDVQNCVITADSAVVNGYKVVINTYSSHSEGHAPFLSGKLDLTFRYYGDLDITTK